MPRWGMVIDLDKCAACQACTVACRAENNVPFAGPHEASLGRAIFWNELIPTVEGEYPHAELRYIPRPCMHCDNTPCTKVCPVKATTRGSEGIVQQIPGRCIGCRLCMCTCPYSARSFNWYHAEWPSPMEKQHNPDVALREKGVVEKCCFCYHRLRKARDKARDEGRELRDEDVVRLPACCQTCPAKARYFGNLDDPESTVARLVRSPRAFRLLEELGSKPKVYYLKERHDSA
ncbi:MAG: 4Fe-4S dicluster domain-containing protein [Planctomycetes bacterium]|nr:4Fe-4S dicluster domain-containing protein [Planctomycetota bacterium]